MKKYLVVMNWNNGTLNVYDNKNNIEIELNLDNSDDYLTYEYFDELPDFDESLLLDCGESSYYVTLFDFEENRGITIPCTENETEDLDNFVEEQIEFLGFNELYTHWYLGKEPMEYISNIL